MNDIALPPALFDGLAYALKKAGKDYLVTNYKQDSFIVIGSVAFQRVGKFTNYEVQTGDTLEKIALKVYGSKSRWVDVYRFNEDKIDDPNLIYPGQILRIGKI